MKLHGLQKMTLLDFPGHVACTVFLGGCDFRCPFCHNYELVDGTAPTVMEDTEFFSFLEKRRGLLDGVAVTGGEPCLHKELPSFLRRIREMGFAVKLDTNGAHPEMLSALLRKRLVDYVAMDIKNSPDKYAMTCGLKEMDLFPIEESIGLLLVGKTDYEFRTTVVDELHEPEDFAAIARWIAEAKQYYLQCFTDRDSVPFGNLHPPSAEKLRRCADAARANGLQSVSLRGVD